MTDRDAWYFVEALKSNTSLTSLDLSNNNFGELGGIYLGGALVSTVVEGQLFHVWHQSWQFILKYC